MAATVRRGAGPPPVTTSGTCRRLVTALELIMYFYTDHRRRPSRAAVALFGYTIGIVSAVLLMLLWPLARPQPVYQHVSCVLRSADDAGLIRTSLAPLAGLCEIRR